MRATQFGKVRERTVSDALALELGIDHREEHTIRKSRRALLHDTRAKDALSAEQGRVSIAINGVVLFLAML